MSSIRSINTNLASEKAQRQLAQNTAGLQSVFERLSSGLRIVHASDDAAGLAIASSLSADNRVYTQGIRNLNDGVSYLNIADGAIDQLKTIVTRSRELATQAANGTMTTPQRGAIDAESQALGKEYNRILATTEFNGSKVFDAANAAISVQCGYGDNEAISARTGEGVITPETVRASVDSSGTQGNSGSDSPSLSADGRYVAFYSGATNLVAGDTNGWGDVFVRDLQSGTTTRVSTDSSGTQGNSSSSSPSISADGRYVAFYSFASNLVAGDTNGQTDTFVRDLQSGTTTRVSIDSSGTQGNNKSFGASISADGRYVAFYSDATNLVAGDTNVQTDIFVRDLQSNTTTRVSTDSSGTQGNGASGNTSISADGRYVAFLSDASNLVAGDTNGWGDVFVRDLQSNTTTRVSVDSSGTQGNSLSQSASISADGRYVAFNSGASNLVAGDTNAAYDVFVRDLQSGTTTRVSSDSSGTQGNSGSDSPSISADGRYVAFYSDATNLVAGDTNAAYDVFVRDLQSNTTTRVSVDPDGTQAGGTSTNPSISADGRYVAFRSVATNLVAGDTNAAGDVFLANNTAISSSAGFTSAVRPLVGIFLKDKTLARMAQGTLDDYLTELNTAQGFIGAAMSRFSVATSTLGTRTEGISAAASRITDTDVAQDAAELTRRNILQQAASAVLAQANQDGQISLQLLKF